MDDEVLPQIEHNLVSSPVLTNSELISIGRPLTPIDQDDPWGDHPPESPRDEETLVTPPPQVTTPVIDNEDLEAQPTPSPQASLAFRRLAKDQAHRSHCQVFQKEKSANPFHVKSFLKPLLL